MESSARQDRLQEQQQKDIALIHTEVEALKVTLIGIDGNNGMRSQITNLTSEIGDIKRCFSDLIQKMSSIDSENSRNDLVYSTKKEQRDMEEKILAKIEEITKQYEEERKEREADKEERKRHLETLKTSRWLLGASIFGIFVSSIITIIS